jgi:hypothetical protein
VRYFYFYYKVNAKLSPEIRFTFLVWPSLKKEAERGRAEYLCMTDLLYMGTPARWKTLTASQSLTLLHTFIFERVLKCCQVRLSANVPRKISSFSSPACTTKQHWSVTQESLCLLYHGPYIGIHKTASKSELQKHIHVDLPADLCRIVQLLAGYRIGN